LAGLDRNVALLEGVWRQQPGHATVRDVLYRTYGTRANLLERAPSRWAEAAEAWEQAAEYTLPEQAALDRAQRARALVLAEDHERALTEIEALLLDLPPKNRELLCRHLLGVCLQGIPLARADKSRPGPEKAALEDRYGRGAVELLSKLKAALGEELW